ncbi:MAG: outer membrane protein transport protein [Deltaproteobacteria bacterium]|nr:outer membrane protein transport protein [Deltaproteobacteria bacterium]
MRQITLATATLLPLCLLAARAEAGGLSVARFGGEHGHPTTDNPTAIYYNPAGIGLSHGVNVFLDGSFALRSIDYYRAAPAEPEDNEVPEPADAKGANNGQATLFNVIALPMIGATAKFGDKPLAGAVGLGFYVPFGGTAIWGKDESFANSTTYPGPYDGTQRWYSIDGTIRSLFFTAAAALSIDKRFHLGLSGNLIKSEINSVRARIATGSNDLTLEGRSLLKADGWQGSLGAGVVVEPIRDELRLGFSYQSRPNIAGGMTLKGKLKNNYGAVSEQDVQMTQDMPDIFRLGASWRPAKYIELRLHGDYTRWSAFTNQCIGAQDLPCEVKADGSAVPDAEVEGGKNGVIVNLPRDWNDTFGVRAGMSYWVRKNIELMTGAGYDSSAIPDSTLEPALLDFNKVSVALGGRFALTDWLQAALTYTSFYYLPRNTAGEPGQTGDLDACEDQERACQAVYKAPSRGPDAGGSYSQYIGVINVNLQGSFDVL